MRIHGCENCHEKVGRTGGEKKGPARVLFPFLLFPFLLFRCRRCLSSQFFRRSSAPFWAPKIGNRTGPEEGLCCRATGGLPSHRWEASEVAHMVRAIRDAPAVAPAPESLQGMLRMAAQLEALADSQAPHRMAAARAIIPPAKAANHTLEVVAGTKVAVKTLPATRSPAASQAASPQLDALLPFVLLLVVLVVVPALLLVLRVVRRAVQGMDLRGATADAAASREPKRMPEGAGGRQPKTVPSAALIAVDSELVLELVLSSQEGSNGRPRQQLLQRARQLSRRHAPPASALAPPYCLSRTCALPAQCSWRRRIPSLRQAFAPATAEREAAARNPPPRPLVSLPPCHGPMRSLVVQLGS